MSRSRQVQILYRADAFLIGYGNTACSLYCLMKPCGHDAGELTGGHAACARVCCAKKSRHVVFGGKSLGDKHTCMLHRCVFFFNIERGRQCVMDSSLMTFITSTASSPLLSRRCGMYMYLTAGKV